MLFKKQGFPEEGEVLLCTVKKILPHSIFVNIDEYKDKEGYIHISEIAPGRIRNIRDYVREDKKIVCKVLDINKEKGYIDLSLRRVPESVKVSKQEEFKQEEKAEKVLESVSKKLGITLEDLYKKISSKVLDRYSLFSNLLQDIAINGESVLKPLALSNDINQALLSIVKDKIKIPEVQVNYDIQITSDQPDGISIIKSSLSKAESKAKELGYKVRIRYISAPRYMMTIVSKDYKTAEKIGNELSSVILSGMKGKGQGSVEKIEK